MFYKNQETAAEEVVELCNQWLNQSPFERKVFYGIVVHGELQAGKTGVLQLSAKGLEKIDPQNDIIASQMYSNTENQRQFENCLIYTSEAADYSLRVDIGGRRIIK